MDEELLFTGISVSEVEKVLQMYDGSGCKTVWIYLMSLKYTHKND